MHPADFPRQCRVAFQGARGAYSELAIVNGLGVFEPQAVPCQNFADVFDLVSRQEVDFGMLPVENALTGSIHDNFDLFLGHPELEIVFEYRQRISHNLIGWPGTSLAEIREVFSHPQGLLQCQGFLNTHRDWKQTAFYDTAGSVAMVAESGDRSKAAIAGSLAAGAYGMAILAPAIETNQRNYTRFALVRHRSGKHASLEWTGRHKASVVFGLADKPGALLEALSCFASRGINLKKIESRPIHGKPFEYMFYVDLELSGNSDKLNAALGSMADCASAIRLLGTYPVDGDIS